MSTATLESHAVETVDVFAAKVDHTNARDAQGTIKLVDRKSINVDWNRNPRLLSKYKYDKAGWLARNIYDNGLIDPLTVSKRADGSLWLLKGHLRYASIMLVVNEGLKEVKKDVNVEAKPAVGPTPDFMLKVRCVVLTGLSMEDELDILMDHGTTTPLDRKEKYNAVKTMVKAGFTQQLIADKMKQSRGGIQKMVNIVLMPKCVEDALLTEEKDALELTDTTVVKLYQAYVEDRKADPTLRVKEAGPKFTAEFEKFVKEGNASRSPSMSASDLQKMASAYTDRDIQDLLDAISKGTKVGGQNAAAAIARIQLRMVPFGQIAPVADPIDQGPIGTVIEGNVVKTVVGPVVC